MPTQLDKDQVIQDVYDPSERALKITGSVTSGGVLVTEEFDYIEAAYPDDTTEIYTYKLGGSGGTTVAEVTVTYVDNTKAEILTVSKV